MADTPARMSYDQLVEFLTRRRDTLIDREADSRAAGIQEALNALELLDLGRRARATRPVTAIPDRLTTSQVADLAGVTTRTVLNWKISGRLRPATRTLGGHARYDRSDVERAIRLRDSDSDGDSDGDGDGGT